mmetsp:Transcript_36706/g.90338  ORF Transcript_36706/g.90338 Transcript_36706/m.90338 type:complete len:397 (-) Transcript_36706:269-1459(-)
MCGNLVLLLAGLDLDALLLHAVHVHVHVLVHAAAHVVGPQHVPPQLDQHHARLELRGAHGPVQWRVPYIVRAVHVDPRPSEPLHLHAVPRARRGMHRGLREPERVEWGQHFRWPVELGLADDVGRVDAVLGARVHVSAAPQQLEHDARVVVPRRKVQRRPPVVVGHVDVGVPADEELDGVLVARRGSRVERGDAPVVARVDVGLVVDEQRGRVRAAAEGRVVERRARVDVAVLLVGAEHDQHLHCLEVPVPRGEVQRAAAVGVRHVDVCADIHKRLNRLRVPVERRKVQRSAPTLLPRAHIGSDDGDEGCDCVRVVVARRVHQRGAAVGALHVRVRPHLDQLQRDLCVPVPARSVQGSPAVVRPGVEVRPERGERDGREHVPVHRRPVQRRAALAV